MDQIPKVDWLVKLIEEHPHVDEIANQYAEMLRMAILRGERHRIVKIVDMAFEAIEQSHVTVDSSVCSVAGQRAGSILEKNAGIRTVRQLCKRTFGELLEVPHIDCLTAGRIVERLKFFGFELRK